MTKRTGRRRFMQLAASFFSIIVFLFLVGSAGFLLVTHPKSPLPDNWNPLRDLSVTAPVTLVTRFQLNRALADEAQCRAVLSADGVAFAEMEDLVVDQNCGISGRGLLSRLVTADVPGVETRCTTALRLAMWEHHVVQPAARDILGSDARALRHLGSYNCRRMRTAQGQDSRWSSHATADSIDIIGVDLADGRTLNLLRDWPTEGPESEFLRQIGQGACDWFRVVLGPNFNKLHADHFHLQGPGWGYCR
ncbi:MULTISPECIES: extensin family protein [unclassified Ruegeria]|uniref:extensin-like domain-containing protein n=1 Tax=unclassified Ruegeria TaxID=2625375 RepID=UPI001ADC5DDE|nr:MULTISPECIES: extensin family protein [unclassified Ruegeria]MBO9412248.1 extensin family protein [Ruegeria sp. R8_1]MBO9417446.1 extensin family protein [Ruegeria sp. R8_2]